MLTKTKKRQSKRSVALIGFFLCAALLTTSAYAVTISQQAEDIPATTKEESIMTTDHTNTGSSPEAEEQPANNSVTPEQADAPVVETTTSQPVAPTVQTSTQRTEPSAARANSKKAAMTPQPAYTTQINDQFEGATLNESLWEVITYPKGYRNNEEQDYRPSQVSLADGKLQITASRDENGEWHSGEVHSKWAYRYGEFEVRMALSATGKGVWPAAWLMGSTDHWPGNGEIDIFENINGSNTIHGTIHGGGPNGHWQIQRSFVGIDVTQYHTYKIVKQPGVMSWWIDGIKRGEWHQSETPIGSVWPFENYSYFGLLNLAIGGNWPGPSDASTPDTIHMYVDSYIVTNAS